MSLDKDWLSTRFHELRPDRYGDGDEWMEPIYWEAKDQLEREDGSADVALFEAARREVRQYEATLQRRGNSIIREAYQSGLWPMDWWELRRLPVKVGDERVALEALTADDLERFADEEEKRAESDYVARLATVEAARSFAAEIRRKRGAKRLGDIVRVDS